MFATAPRRICFLRDLREDDGGFFPGGGVLQQTLNALCNGWLRWRDVLQHFTRNIGIGSVGSSAHAQDVAERSRVRRVSPFGAILRNDHTRDWLVIGG
jgi:hypothetical protein